MNPFSIRFVQQSPGQAQQNFIQLLPAALKDESKTTLVVGNLSRWKADGRKMPEAEGLVFVEIRDLTADIITQTRAAIILSPLVADDFDVVDVAERLISLGFQGRYRAIALSLPAATRW